MGVAQHVEHAVDVPHGAGAALDAQTHRLVEHQNVRILIQRDRLEERAGLVRLAVSPSPASADRAATGGMRTACPASRRSFGCARLPLTRSSPFRMTRWIWEKAQARKPRFQEAVHPHAGFVGRNGDRLDAGVAARRSGPVGVWASWPRSATRTLPFQCAADKKHPAATKLRPNRVDNQRDGLTERRSQVRHQQNMPPNAQPVTFRASEPLSEMWAE